MKSITLKELPDILDNARNKGTVENPYSILLVGECGTGVRTVTKSWFEKRREHGDRVLDRFFLEYDISIRSSDIVICDARLFNSKEKEKANNFYYDLIHKKGSVDDKLKLVITQVYAPLWLDGDPLFGPDDYNLFDEVIFVEANVEVFKEYFIEYMDEDILFEESDENVTRAEELKEMKKIGLFVLNHPKFHFIPIETDGTPDTYNGGLKSDFFNPLTFIQIITWCHSLDEILNELNNGHLFITPKGKKMLLEILSEYKQ